MHTIKKKKSALPVLEDFANDAIRRERVFRDRGFAGTWWKLAHQPLLRAILLEPTNVGPLLLHLCLCALLRPHSIDSLAHAPLTIAAYAGGQCAKEHIFVCFHFRKEHLHLAFRSSFFPRLTHSFFFIFWSSREGNHRCRAHLNIICIFK